jgi:AcrR family transcriptional regulator
LLQQDGQTASPRTARRRAKLTSRQLELLAQLEETFFAEGFLDLTMDQLAERLQCSKSTLYALGSSKEELVLRVTKGFFAAAAEAIEATVGDADDPGERILRYLHGVGEAMSSMSTAYYEDMLSYTPTADVYRQNAQAAARRVRDLVADGVTRGVFRDVDGMFAAQLCALAIEGIHSGQLLRPTGLTAGAAFSALGDLMLGGLRKR